MWSQVRLVNCSARFYYNPLNSRKAETLCLSRSEIAQRDGNAQCQAA